MNKNTASPLLLVFDFIMLVAACIMTLDTFGVMMGAPKESIWFAMDIWSGTSYAVQQPSSMTWVNSTPGAYVVQYVSEQINNAFGLTKEAIVSEGLLSFIISCLKTTWEILTATCINVLLIGYIKKVLMFPVYSIFRIVDKRHERTTP